MNSHAHAFPFRMGELWAVCDGIVRTPVPLFPHRPHRTTLIEAKRPRRRLGETDALVFARRSRLRDNCRCVRVCGADERVCCVVVCAGAVCLIAKAEMVPRVCVKSRRNVQPSIGLVWYRDWHRTD